MRRRWPISGPNASSIRRAISAVSEALPRRRSDRVARRTFRISAAFVTLSPSGAFNNPSVVIDEIDVARHVRRGVVIENQPPVSGYCIRRTPLWRNRPNCISSSISLFGVVPYRSSRAGRKHVDVENFSSNECRCHPCAVPDAGRPDAREGRRAPFRAPC